MIKNMGSIDRIMRLLAAGVIAILYLTDQITSTAAIVLGAFAVILLLTSFIAFCPLYVPFKLSTCKQKK
jgi:hypothetical protein